MERQQHPAYQEMRCEVHKNEREVLTAALTARTETESEQRQPNIL